jgi:3-hydroxybutyryl-CoA dehydratase
MRRKGKLSTKPAEIQGKTIQEMNIGDLTSFRKTVTETDVYLFAGITGDMNPLHIDQVYAATTQFSKPLAHGVIGVGMLVGVMARELPGGVLLGESVKFLQPVFIGDTITAFVKVIDKNDDKDLITFKIWCENQNGVTVMEGEAQGLVKKRR